LQPHDQIQCFRFTGYAKRGKGQGENQSKNAISRCKTYNKNSAKSATATPYSVIAFSTSNGELPMLQCMLNKTYEAQVTKYITFPAATNTTPSTHHSNSNVTNSSHQLRSSSHSATSTTDVHSATSTADIQSAEDEDCNDWEEDSEYINHTTSISSYSDSVTDSDSYKITYTINRNPSTSLTNVMDLLGDDKEDPTKTTTTEPLNSVSCCYCFILSQLQSQCLYFTTLYRPPTYHPTQLASETNKVHPYSNRFPNPTNRQ